jgi:Minor capsid protein
MSVTVTGLDLCLANLNRLLDKNLISEPMADLAEEILRRTDSKIPHQEGILKSSGTVIPDGGDGETSVGYNSEYASYQHQGVRQDGSRIIKNRPGDGESFFLSSTVKQNKDALLAYYAKQTGKQLAATIKFVS